MRAAAIDRFGGVEVLRLRDLPVPTVGDDDVLIRVEAAGLGTWDIVEREGAYDGAFGVPSAFPYVLGWDGAGTLAAVGRNVTRFAEGDRVYAATMPLPRGGCYAQYAVVRQEHVALAPAALSIGQAAALPWDALTALSGLDALEVRSGQSVLVFGASGGIGHLALQLAVARGARVLAIASGPDGVDLARRLGAHSSVDGRREDVVAAARSFAPGGVDAALLTAGGVVADRAASVVRDGGSVAWPNGVTPEPHPRPVVRAVTFDGARDVNATSRLNRLVDSGALHVHIDKVFAFDDVAAAHRALAAHHLGKLVLRITHRGSP
jgi:NADPH:quinone reductase-like Zn-dependent oxidoreductase